MGTARQAVGHIERIVDNRPTIVARCRCKHLFADTAAIHIDFVQAEAADVERRPPHRHVVRPKFSAQTACAEAAVRVFYIPRERGIPADPATTPVRFAEQAHTPFGCIAPCAFAARRPNFDFPIAACVATEPHAVIGHPDRFVRFDPSRIPQITLTCSQRFGRRGNQYTIGPLHHGSFIRFDNPTQPRMLRFDIEGTFHPFSTQSADPHRRLHASGQQQKRRQNPK